MTLPDGLPARTYLYVGTPSNSEQVTVSLTFTTIAPPTFDPPELLQLENAVSA